MALPWVRLDSNIATHPKILALLAEKDGPKAFVLYVSALGYAGGHGTDGTIPRYALSVLHGNDKLATLLVDKGLWEYAAADVFSIHNFASRQELAAVTAGKRMAQSIGGKKAMCHRHHGPNCGCWKEGLAI